jgi:hypothetical protein
MKKAQQWHWEQLLDLWRLWELWWRRQMDAGLIPMTQPPMMISDTVLGVENNENIATDILPLSQIQPLTSPHLNLDSQCRDPFWLTVWCNLTSIMHKPWCWQVISLTPSKKTTKMLLWFCHPMTMSGSSHASSPWDLASLKPKLPKGWVYEVEEVHAEVKTEVVNPAQYLTLDALLTCSKCKQVDDLTDNLYR